jgi:predicted methyltransferase MtxX (methanogen marker protein 4)
MDTAKRALNGDAKARQQIIDILIGKNQNVDVTSSDGSMSPLDIKVEFIKAKQE